MSYILKESKRRKDFKGKERLTDKEYKMLAENLKLYYRKYTKDDLDEDFDNIDQQLNLNREEYF